MQAQTTILNPGTMQQAAAINYTDEEQLIQAAKRNPQQFAALYDKYYAQILKFVYQRLTTKQDAYDITQQVFVQAMLSLEKYEYRGLPFSSWLYRIAINTAKNYLVSRGRRPPDSDVSSEDAEFYDGDHGLKDLESPERALLRDEIEGTVHRTIQQLPEDLRTALTLREFDGLSYEDIASVMQCPVGTVRSRIFRAREAIDKALQPLLQET